MLASVVLLLGGLLQQGVVQVRASLSDDRIAVGATTMLQVTVEADGGRPAAIEVPSLPPSLDVLSSREYLQTQLSLPGGRTTIVRRDIVLRARAEGLFTIDPVVVRLEDGTVRRTRPLTLRVVATAAGAPLPPGVRRPLAGTTADAGTLLVDVVPDTAWLGEPVLLRMTARIPEEQRTRRGRSPTFEPPVAVGFWAQEVEDRGAVGVRAIGGRYYDIHEYRRLYVPLTAGEHVLPPGRAVYEVDRGWMFAPQTYEIVGDTVRLPVRALPEAGQPATFTGAVGRFDVRASLDRTSLAEGDAATLTVEVEGSGNIKALPAPDLPPIPGVEAFDPTEDATFSARTTGIRGRKRFRWILTPDRPGTHRLPDVAYAWFDPQTERYDSVRIALSPLVVSGTIAASTPDDTTIAPLRLLPARSRFGWAQGTPFVLLLSAPLLLIAAALAWRAQAPRLQARRTRRRSFTADFTRIRAQAHADPRGALGALQHALDTATGGRSRGAEEELRAGGAGEDALASLRALREAIHSTRFRREPVDAGDVDALVRRAEMVLRRIERATRARRASVVGLLLPLLLGITSAVGHGQDAAFARAVAAYERGFYDDARAGFVAHLRTHPADAAAWFDLGNADFRRGARGAALHAWARALQLEPRAADARRNLRLAGAAELAAVAVRPVPFTRTELLAFAALAWLVGGTLLALRILRGPGGRALPIGASIALSLCFVALLGAAAHAAVPAHGVVVREATLRAGPGLHAEARGAVDEGALVRIVGAREEWVHVRRDAEEGWVEQRDIGRL